MTMPIVGIKPESGHDLETVTSDQLIANMHRWTLKWVEDAVRQTERAVCFRESGDDRDFFFWVPKSACEAVNYLAASGRFSGAVRFPARFVTDRR